MKKPVIYLVTADKNLKKSEKDYLCQFIDKKAFRDDRKFILPDEPHLAFVVRHLKKISADYEVYSDKSKRKRDARLLADSNDDLYFLKVRAKYANGFVSRFLIKRINSFGMKHL